MIKKRFKISHPIQVGLSFGLTSGVITTLGLMVGLYAGTHSKTAVFAGIITIALADAMSDALGIHIAEENENVHSSREVWLATLTTFLAKFIISGSFVLSLLCFEAKKAVVVNIVYGIALMTVYNYFVGRKQSVNTWSVIVEHLLIAGLVIVVSYMLGQWVNKTF